MKFVKYNKAKKDSVSYVKSVITNTASNISPSNNSQEAEHAKEAEKALQADKLTNTVKLWGNDFDGSADVNGDITVGAIKVDSISPKTEEFIDLNGYVSIANDLDVSGALNVTNDAAFRGAIDADGSISSGIDIYAEGDIDAGNNITANNYILSRGNLDVEGITNLYDNTFTSSLYPQETDSFNIGSSSLRYNKLYSKNIDNSDSITTKNLTVTGSAHFFELMIDKIRSVGGAALFTPADGFTIDRFKSRDLFGTPIGYTLYWKALDEDGNARINKWKVGDLALCMSFNQGKVVGTSHNVSNKYWWALVNVVLDNVELDGVKYNGINISAMEGLFDGELNIEVGDEVVMLGSRDASDPERASAIYISSYNGLDSGIKAPFIAQYKGINDFNLASHRKSYFDAVGAKFVGNFEITKDLMEDIISQVSGGTAPYISDGTDGFTANHWIVWDSANKLFKDSGIVAKGTNGTNGYSPYIDDGYWYYWNGTQYVRGDKAQGSDGHSPYIQDGFWYYWNGTEYVKGNKAEGAAALEYRLYPVTEQAIVKSNENLDIDLLYLVYKQEGATKTDWTSNIMSVADPNWWYIVFNDNTSSHTTVVPLAVYNGTYKTKYFTNKLTNIRSITVKLYDGNTLWDSRTIPVIYEPSATFEVNLELGSIKSRVTGTENSIGGLTTKVTEVELTAEGLKTRVASTESGISGLNTRVTTVETNATGLTTRVAANETNIAGVTDRVTTVELTASGLTSTVSKMNVTGSRINLLPESNLTGRCNNIRYNGSEGLYNTVVKNAFNGMNSYRAYIPVLYYSSTNDNFKYNGLRWGSDGHKSIKLTPNKKYTLSVWAKANVANSRARIEVHRTNGQYGNRISGGNFGTEFIPTSAWKQYLLEFTPTNEFYEVFIFTYNNRTATSNATTVQDVEFCMPLLTDNGVTEYSLSAEDKDVVQGNLLDNTKDFTLGGNLVVANGTLGNYNNSSKFIRCNNSADYTELLLWNFNNSQLEGNRDYVLSFHAKAGSGNQLNCIFYSPTASNDSQARYSENDDGYKSAYYTTVTLSEVWRKVYVHFHTVNSLENEIRVLLRLTNGNDVYVAQPKLEIGADFTEWTASNNDYETPANVNSKIELSATNIKLSVNNDLRSTGINIEDGVISLNAQNTIVSDNLTVKSLETSGLDATITINDGLMQVFGLNKTQPNIVFGVDEDGYAVLKYYDNDGNLKYNLGPDGIMNAFTETYSKFSNAFKFIRIDNGTTLNNSFSSIDASETGTNYYRFSEGYKMIGNLKQYKISGTSVASTYHLSYYNSTAMTTRPTGTMILDGWYFNGLTSPTVNDKYRIVEAVKMTAGKLTAKMNVYVVYDTSTGLASWKLADSNFIMVSNKTPQDYLTLTGLNQLL